MLESYSYLRVLQYTMIYYQVVEVVALVGVGVGAVVVVARSGSVVLEEEAEVVVETALNSKP